MDRNYQIEAPAQTSDAITLVCSTCGQQFAIQSWQPSLCCPACHTIGSPDRANIHLLAQTWDCDRCGTANSGLHNFCVECGAGLASRCLRCEYPVYSATCAHCGTHQAQLRRYQSAQAERTHWQPLISSYAQEQDKPPVDNRLKQAPRPGSRWQFKLSWGWVWILAGVLLLFLVIAPGLVDVNSAPGMSLPFDLNAGSLKEIWAGVQSTLQTRLQLIFDTLSALSNIKPGDANYPLLLGGIVFIVSLFPLLLYFIGRIINYIIS